MLTRETIETVRRTAEELRQRGEQRQARALEALLDAAERDENSTGLLTSGEAGDLLGVSGQTIKSWIRQGRIAGYRVGHRIMVPSDAVAEYVLKARSSLDLDEVSDEEAAHLVGEARRHL